MYGSAVDCGSSPGQVTIMSKVSFVLPLLGAIAAIALAESSNETATKTPTTCGKSEVYSECGSSCPKTCDNRDNTCLVCLAVCVEGCFCAAGTVRAQDGSCVPPTKCPPRTCAGANEVFEKCPPTCPRTQNCSNLWVKPGQQCTDIDCCTPQCRCKKGFYRDRQNKCVSAKECMAQKGGVSTAQSETTADTVWPFLNRIMAFLKGNENSNGDYPF